MSLSCLTSSPGLNLCRHGSVRFLRFEICKKVLAFTQERPSETASVGSVYSGELELNTSFIRMLIFSSMFIVCTWPLSIVAHLLKKPE